MKIWYKTKYNKKCKLNNKNQINKFKNLIVYSITKNQINTMKKCHKLKKSYQEKML